MTKNGDSDDQHFKICGPLGCNYHTPQTYNGCGYMTGMVGGGSGMPKRVNAVYPELHHTRITHAATHANRMIYGVTSSTDENGEPDKPTLSFEGSRGF